MLLLVARLHALFLAPRADDVATAARAAAMRVIDGIHHLAAHARTTPHPARLPRLAPRQQLVLLVADDADRRQAAPVNHAHLRRGHAHRHVVAFLGDDLRRHARRPPELTTLADLELDVVYRGA